MAGLAVDPVVDRQVARRADLADEVDGLSLRSHGADEGAQQYVDPLAGRGQRVAGVVDVLSPRVSR